MTAAPTLPELQREIDVRIAAGEASVAHRLLAQLWREAPTPSLAGFVAARFDQIAEAVGARQLRVALLRSFTVEPIVPLLRAGGVAANLHLTVEVGGFNAYPQELLDPASRLYAAPPEVIVLAVQTRDVAPALWGDFASLDPGAVDAEVARVVGDFTRLIDALRARSTSHLIVHNLEAPASPVHGLLDGRSEHGQIEAIQRLNHQLAQVARARRGVYVLDYDGLVARHGRLAWHDEAKWLAMRMPIAAPQLLHLANAWLRHLHPLCGRQCKVLVTDLDNTLWGGVIGEDGMAGIRLGVEYPGAAFRALQQVLLDLRRRGVLLAVCSKNNPADAIEVLDHHPEMLLRSAHFSSLRIGWEDKAAGLRAIAAELRLGLDALAFVDDNPAERALVREQLPEVTVIELPRDPMAYARLVRDCPLFERLALSAEDQARDGYYVADRRRAELQGGAASLEDFYRSLEMEVEIGRVDDETVARVAQLTQKTNQFNLTTRRRSEPEVAALAVDPSWRLLWMRVRDRFGDHGLVGVAFTHLARGRCEIDTLLLSCRVIGRTVETALLAAIADEARAAGAQQLVGRFAPTAKNAPAREFFPAHGFSPDREGDDASDEAAAGHPAGASRWTLALAGHAINAPPWIRRRPHQGAA